MLVARNLSRTLLPATRRSRTIYTSSSGRHALIDIDMRAVSVAH